MVDVSGDGGVLKMVSRMGGCGEGIFHYLIDGGDGGCYCHGHSICSCMPHPIYL